MAVLLTTDKVEVGQVLSEPVINNFGQTLIPSGTTLNARHVRVLKTWNVRTVSIRTEGDSQELIITDQVYKLAEERLRQRLHWIARNPNEQDLIHMGIARHAQVLAMKSRNS